MHTEHARNLLARHGVKDFSVRQAAWVLEAMLADPNQWAMVVATTPPHTPPLAEPGFVCELRVDDVVVATDAGPEGALCSLRTW